MRSYGCVCYFRKCFSQVLFFPPISRNFMWENTKTDSCPVLYEGFPTCLIFHVPSIIPGPRWSKVPVMTSSFRHPLSIQIQFNFYNPNVILTYVVTFKNNPIQYIGATNNTAGCIQLICIFTYYYYTVQDNPSQWRLDLRRSFYRVYSGRFAEMVW